ncbi:MAG: iron-containing alcohol dehydrogenase [Verrucomicrobia bacterium]|nr:iron-containing alcohol dehydrogenase [Verrucomicrobiota bacterium]MBI3869269.1 iron-containing alcohol dehydrogenase [Verrucomicrobiota bacterium]
MTFKNDAASAQGGFDHVPRTRLIYGEGTSESAGERARELGGARILLVTDPGIVRAGHAEGVISSIERAGLKAHLYDRARENPTTRDVEECVVAARAAQADLLIGLGGGSSMDTAKGCNFILTNGGRMKDYWGVGKATRPMLPLIAIPTTAGTGSECQSAALIADESTHQKMACLDPKAAARVAILDPRLTLSQPPRVTACTGLDALAHALETAVATQRNAISIIYSREAFRLCGEAFEKVLRSPGDLAARGRMLLGAAFAGTAIENSMLGAAHAAANPLTAHHNIIHGHAVGMLAAAVVEWNSADPDAAAGYLELARAAHLAGVQDLVRLIRASFQLSGLPSTLKACGVPEHSLPGLADEAASQWTVRFNPRPAASADFLRLYQSIWS